MKKIISIALAIFTFFALLSLTACFSAEGTYKFSQMEVRQNGQTQTIKCGEQFDEQTFDRNSAVMTVFVDKSGKYPLNKLTFNAPYWFSEELKGSWEYQNDKTEAVLNVVNDGLEIVIAQAKDGNVTVWVYTSDFDYILTLTK